MKLSKVILLSTVCVFGYAADYSYAAYKTSGNLSLISTSGIHTCHTHNTLTYDDLLLPSVQFNNKHNIAPSLSREGWGGYESKSSYLLSLTGLIPPQELQPNKVRGVLAPPTQGEDNRLNVFKTASVCFITDTGNCGQGKFNPGPQPTPPEDCEAAGYTNEPCPHGSSPEGFCPIDPSYHSECVCDDDYNKTCDSAAGLKPVNANDTCDGKYKECCNICEGYDYTSIPSGYVKDGECDSCDGKKYKVKCDTTLYPVTSGVCGSYGGSGGTCSDDTGAHYKKCNCPNNYEWNAGQKKCVCATSFKYSCNGTGYAGGVGKDCNGKYSKCVCASGYTWNAASGSCVCSGTDWCAVNQNCAALGYAQQTCSRAAVKCPFDVGYSYCL